MTGLLEGDVVLATGGGSGIGRAAVDAFVAEGARVGVLERSREKLEALKADYGDKIVAIEGDATTLEANQRAVHETVAAFGKLDTLACFVGIYDLNAGLVDLKPEIVDAAFDEMFSINVKSNILAARAAVDELVKSEGRIIFTVSSSGFIPGGGGVLYTASKFAARGVVTALAHELAPKVRVNAVAPGGTISDLRGLKALGQDAIRTCAEMPYLSTPIPYDPQPAIHAPVYVQLASRAFTAAMTGQFIRPDGGMDSRGISRAAGNAESTMW